MMKIIRNHMFRIDNNKNLGNNFIYVLVVDPCVTCYKQSINELVLVFILIHVQVKIHHWIVFHLDQKFIL